MALAQLDIRPTSTVWDIGAGSGARLAIESAQLASLGIVYAIEPEAADIALIQSNAEAFGVPNVRPVAGHAPEVLTGLPDPDAVFIGGLGRQFDRLINAVYERMSPGGNLVINVATIEGLASAYQSLKNLAVPVRVWNISIARGIEQMENLRFDAIAPSFLLAVTKNGPERALRPERQDSSVVDLSATDSKGESTHACRR